MGFLLSLILLPVWLYLWPSPSIDAQSSFTDHQYAISCLVYTLSAFLELATEPMWLVCQLGMFVRARIVLEATANIARALGIIFSLLLGDANSHGLYLLAFPQVE